MEQNQGILTTLGGAIMGSGLTLVALLVLGELPAEIATVSFGAALTLLGALLVTRVLRTLLAES